MHFLAIFSPNVLLFILLSNYLHTVKMWLSFSCLGRTWKQKIDDLKSQLSDAKVDALVVSALDDLACECINHLLFAVSSPVKSNPILVSANSVVETSKISSLIHILCENGPDLCLITISCTGNIPKFISYNIKIIMLSVKYIFTWIFLTQCRRFWPLRYGHLAVGFISKTSMIFLSGTSGQNSCSYSISTRFL